MKNQKALNALQELYRFFDVLTESQRVERDQCVQIIREALEK